MRERVKYDGVSRKVRTRRAQVQPMASRKNSDIYYQTSKDKDKDKRRLIVGKSVSDRCRNRQLPTVCACDWTLLSIPGISACHSPKRGASPPRHVTHTLSRHFSRARICSRFCDIDLQSILTHLTDTSYRETTQQRESKQEVKIYIKNTAISNTIVT